MPAPRKPQAAQGSNHVTVPIGPPVCASAATPPPRGTLDPGFRRPAPGLSERIAGLWRAFPGKTGIAVQRIDGEWAIAQRGSDLFPQQSVSKLWVTMSILDAVDNGRISLDQKVRIGPEDLVVFHQPLASRVQAEGSVSMSVRDLIETAITQSDNLANDSLLRTVGGPNAVRAFVSKKDLGSIRFGPGERLLQAGTAGLTWQQSYANYCNFQAARAALPMATRQAAMNKRQPSPIRSTGESFGDRERADAARARNCCVAA